MPFELFAQLVSGQVVEKTTEKPIRGAVVCAINGRGKIIGYGTTRESGTFSLTITAEVDSLKITCLGYVDTCFRRPFKDSYLVPLVASAQSLREVVVTAPKVVNAGDTIRYNVNALKRPEDKHLSDMLVRIPGIEVDKQGYVSYNGQQITRFYVEGKNVLDNSYNLAIKNLSVNAVKELEVLENHQPYKLLLGKFASDKAAINIVLNDAFRGRWNGTVAAGAGISDDEPKTSASAHMAAFFLGKELSSVNVAGYDGQGYALRDADYAAVQEKSFNHSSLSQNIGNSMSGAPLEDKRSLFGHNYELSTIDRKSSRPDNTFGVSLKLGRDVQTSNLHQTTRYLTKGATETTLSRNEENWGKQRRISGLVTFTENNRSFYLSNKLFAWASVQDGSSLVTGGMNRQSLMHAAEWNVENEATGSFLLLGRVFSIETFTQFSGLAEKMLLQDGAVGQTIDSRLFEQDIYLSEISRRVGRWHFTLRPDAKWQAFRRGSMLDGIPEALVPGEKEETLTASVFKTQLKGDITYSLSPVEFSLEGQLFYDHYSLKGLKTDKVLGRASFSFKYDTGRWSGILRGNYGYSGTDLQSFGQAILLTDYYSLKKGQILPSYIPSAKLSAELKYREPISGWNLHLSSDGVWSESYLTSRDIYEGYVVNYLNDEKVPVRSFNGLAQWSGRIIKGFLCI